MTVVSPPSAVHSHLRPFSAVGGPTQEFLGQGSFGHVTMVRKKEGVMGGALFALKSLSKDAVVEGGQVHHLKDEKHVRQHSHGSGHSLCPVPCALRLF